MTSVTVKSRVVPTVDALVVPVPRTAVITDVWSEFALALGVPASQINSIIRKGLDNFLLGTAIILFLNSQDEALFDVTLQMDWDKHRAMLDFETNIDLCPQLPFTEQLHSNFQRVLTYLRRAKVDQGVTRVELHVRYRDEIYANPEMLECARAFLGLVPAKPHKYASGIRQPDMIFRFAPVPETTFTVREIWPD